MRHYIRSIRRKFRRWLRDPRYRDQRRFLTVGSLVTIGGLIASIGFMAVSATVWIVFIVTLAVFIVILLSHLFDNE